MAFAVDGPPYAKWSSILIMLCLICVTHGQTCVTWWSGAAQFDVPDFFYPFDPSTDKVVPVNDDGSSDRVETLTDFPFFNRRHQSLFVNTNGVVSFDKPITAFTPRPFPLHDILMIAAFWADVDTSANNGRVYYRETTDEAMLCQFSEYVQNKFIDFLDFNATWMFVATWHKVTFYGGSPRTTVNSFQIVLGTNGRHSFALFNYGSITWTTGTAQESGGDPATGLGGIPAQVGFNSGDDQKYYVIPESRNPNISNIDQLRGKTTGDVGRFLFRVDTEDITESDCIQEGTVLLWPRLGLLFGGKSIFISGPCYDEDTEILCKFGKKIVAGTAVDSRRATCLTPTLRRSGLVDFTMSTNGGKSFTFNATYFVVDSDSLYTVTRERNDRWLFPPYEGLKITWNPGVFKDSATVDISMVTFDDDPENGITKAIMSDTPNDGEEVFSPLAAGLNDTDDVGQVFYLCTIKISSTNSSASNESIWSDYHVAFWYDARLIYEVISRVEAGLTVSDEAKRVYSLIQEQASGITMQSSRQRKKRATTLSETNLQNLVIKALPKMTGVIKGNDQCSKWMELEQKDPPDFSDVTPPPCTLQQAENDGRFEIDRFCDGTSQTKPSCQYYHQGAHKCYCSVQNSPSGHGQQACYSSKGRLITDPYWGGGTLDKTSDRISVEDHIRQDIQPYIFCCKAANKCKDYYQYRPTVTCNGYNPPRPVWTGGDPHFFTGDGLNYTFNGLGEYWLIQSDVHQVQARFVETSIGANGRATITSALIVKEGDLPRIQIQTGNIDPIEIRIDGKMKNFDDFGKNTIPLFGAAVLLRFPSESEAKLTFQSPDCIVDVRIKQISGALSNQILLKGDCGNVKGLLGNFDGDASNDLTFQSGKVLNTVDEPTPQDIHAFGESWRVTEEESLFTYPSGMDYSSFNDPEFEPTLFDPKTLLSSPGVTTCGKNMQCLFDLQVTGDVTFANITMMSAEKIEESNELYETAIKSPCFSNPCEYDGTCTDNGVDYQCTCDPLYTGDRCQTVIDICGQNPCQNNGKCTPQNDGNTFSCLCRSGFAGERCEEVDLTNPCEASICTNNGTCFYANFRITCVCTDGFTGAWCETAAHDDAGMLLTVTLIVIAVLTIVLVSALLVWLWHKGYLCGRQGSAPI